MESMATVYAFLANGFEEVECLAAADVLVRSGVRVRLISVTGKKEVHGSHHFGIRADALIEKVNPLDADLLMLPGGQPGTENLYACKMLCDALLEANRQGKRIAAICAAPSILGRLGLLEDRRATCYPGYESSLAGAKLTGAGVVTDGNITTARGVGLAFDFGLEMVKLLVDPAVAANVAERMLYEA
jgi:4-methyl-5(b-hydroxyethyl)-thiazole monophosphate biosynthesis